MAARAGEQQFADRFWGNAKLPTAAGLRWVKGFGNYPDFDPHAGKLSRRLSLEVANLKAATQIIVFHHYLHRGRTMAQLPYWILVDQQRVGMILFAYPRLSVPLFKIAPMNLLELARLWIHPSVQNQEVRASNGETHTVSIASCAVGRALSRLRQDWVRKYPQLPDVRAVVSWADTAHHEGTIYKAANFKTMGASGGTMHGNRARPNGGRDQMNPDYQRVKTLFMFQYASDLSAPEKKRLQQVPDPIPTMQLSLAVP